MSREADYYWQAYVKAAAAIDDAMDILSDMHDGEECKFSGGDGCLACLAQGALMEAGRGEDNRVKNG